jgi:TonB-dependent receptor
MRYQTREAAAAATQAKLLSRAVHAGLIGGLAVLPVEAMGEEAIEGDTRQQLQQLDTVTVTGSYARSLERAVDLKRANIGFSDSIVATDVADFPEQNLAEALQRMPGVTIERNKGLGSRVSVRGLPSEFTLVSINNLATASGSGGRDVQFDIFASDVVQTVTVQKSPTAADEEGGIAGSVYIETAKPFDFPEPKFSASAEASHNSINGKIDPKISFLASDTWGNWGGLVSFSKAKRTNRTDSNSGINFRPMGRFLEASGTRGSQAAAVLARDAGIVVSNRMDKDETSRIVFQDKVGDRVYLNEQDQWGATASLQFKPSDTFSLSFDAMLGGYDTHEDEYDAAAYSASSRSTLDTIHDYDRDTLSAYGITVLKDVSYTATQHESRSKERNADTDYRQFSSTLDWKVGNWDIDALVGYSGARKDSDYANLKHVAYAPSRTRWTRNGGETVPSTIGGFDMYNRRFRHVQRRGQVPVRSVRDRAGEGEG